MYGDPIIQHECPTCSGSGELFDSLILNPKNSGKSTFLRGIEQERERCAKIAEDMLGPDNFIARKIRSAE